MREIAENIIVYGTAFFFVLIGLCLFLSFCATYPFTGMLLLLCMMIYFLPAWATLLIVAAFFLLVAAALIHDDKKLKATARNFDKV